MTIKVIVGIVIVGILGILGLVGGICKCADNEKASGVSIIVFSILIACVLIATICFWQFHTESGQRALKTQQSNLNGGIERTVSVYDVNGELITEYHGKFDVETDGEARKILFDDENGKRHIVYYTTGTVVIDEE